MLKKLRKKLPRRELAWLSLEKVLQVNDDLLRLYIEPGLCIACAPPYFSPVVKYVEIHAGMPVMFQWYERIHRDGETLRRRAWLSLSRERLPCWTYQLGEGEVEYRVSFQDTRVRIPVELLRHFSRYFPFVPTNNCLVNDGKVVA